MHLLTDVRTFFRRRRLTPAAAAGPSGGASGSGAAPNDLGSRRTAETTTISRGATDAAGGATATKPAQTVEAKPAKLRIGESQRSHDELVGLVRRLGEHMDEQGRRSDRLEDALDGVPAGMETLTDLNRHAAVLVETIQDHLSRLSAREEQVDAVLGRLAEATGRQAQATELLRQRVEQGAERTDRLDATLRSLHGALDDLAVHERRSMETLDRVVASARERDDRLLAGMAKTSRWLAWTVGTCGAVGIAAVVMAVIALAA